MTENLPERDCEKPKITLEIQRDETNPKIAVVRDHDYAIHRRRLLTTMTMVAGIGAWAGPSFGGGSWSGPQVSPEQYAAAICAERTHWQLFGKPPAPARPRPKNCSRAKRRGRTQCR